MAWSVSKATVKNLDKILFHMNTTTISASQLIQAWTVIIFTSCKMMHLIYTTYLQYTFIWIDPGVNRTWPVFLRIVRSLIHELGVCDKHWPGGRAQPTHDRISVTLHCACSTAKKNCLTSLKYSVQFVSRGRKHDQGVVYYVWQKLAKLLKWTSEKEAIFQKRLMNGNLKLTARSW